MGWRWGCLLLSGRLEGWGLYMYGMRETLARGRVMWDDAWTMSLC